MGDTHKTIIVCFCAFCLTLAITITANVITRQPLSPAAQFIESCALGREALRHPCAIIASEEKP